MLLGAPLPAPIAFPELLAPPVLFALPDVVAFLCFMV
ncbi:protein of unknown function (plasmid) [Pararobbsia alpina]